MSGYAERRRAGAWQTDQERVRQLALEPATRHRWAPGTILQAIGPLPGSKLCAPDGPSRVRVVDVNERAGRYRVEPLTKGATSTVLTFRAAHLWREVAS